MSVQQLARYCTCGRLATMLFVECFHGLGQHPLRAVPCCRGCHRKHASSEPGRETYLLDRSYVEACETLDAAVALRSLATRCAA